MNETAAVLAVERAWTEAHLRGDFAALARIMAEDYVRIESDGSARGKAEVLAAYQPERRVSVYAAGDEYDVRLYGDTAVIVGRWTARGANNGAEFDYRARFLTVYVKRAGQWRMVAEQSTAIAPGANPTAA